MGISKTSAHCVLMQVLGKQMEIVWWLPHFLSAEQKATRSKIVHELLTRYKNEGETFLGRIIATDETWIWDLKPEMKS